MPEAVSAIFPSPASSHRTASAINEDGADAPVTAIACATESHSPILAQGAANHITIQDVPLEGIIGELYSRGTNSDNTF